MKRIHLLSVLALLLVVASCGKGSCSRSNEEQVRCMIPKDASLVIAVNTGNILDHLGVKDEGLPDGWKDIIGERRLNKLNELFSDVEKSGVNLGIRTYIFSEGPLETYAPGKVKHKIGEDGDIIDVVEEAPSSDITMLVPLVDEDKAIKFIENQGDVKFEKTDGMMVAKRNGTALVVNDKVLVVFDSDKDVVKRAKDLYDRKEEASILKNDDAENCFNQDDDVCAYFNLKAAGLTDELKDVPFLSGLSSMGVYLSFADEQMAMRMKFYGIENDLGDLMESIVGTPSTDFLAQIPDGKFVAAFNVSLNGKNIAELPLVKMALDNIAGQGEGAEIEQLLGMSLTDLVSSIEGISATGANDGDPEQTKAFVALRTSKASQLLTLIKQMLKDNPEEGISLVNGNVVINHENVKMTLSADNKQLYGRMSNASDSTMVVNNDMQSFFAKNPVAVYVKGGFDDMTGVITATADLKAFELNFALKVNTPDGK